MSQSPLGCSEKNLCSNRTDVLRSDQDIDLFEKPLKMLLVSPEKPFSLPLRAGDDFNLDDIVDKIHAAVLLTSLIGSGWGTHSECAETAINSSRICLNLSASISVPSLYFNGR
jgi:hypothetical protein